MSQNVQEIIERAKKGLQIKTNSGLASFFGVKPNTISAWISRNSINYDLLFIKCELLQKEWLLTGEGEMYVTKDGQRAAGTGIVDTEAEGNSAGGSKTKSSRTHSQCANQQHPATETTTVQQPQNDRLTHVQQTVNANAAAQSIKTAPFFYEAIGRRLAVREESIEEGDILVIDPVIPAAEGDLILRSSTEGPEIVKYQPGEKNIKGVVVSLTRQYPAINRQ